MLQELLALQESIMDTESLQDMFNRLELKQKKEETNDSIASWNLYGCLMWGWPKPIFLHSEIL